MYEHWNESVVCSVKLLEIIAAYYMEIMESISAERGLSGSIKHTSGARNTHKAMIVSIECTKY